MQGKRWAALERAIAFGRWQPLAMAWRNVPFQKRIKGGFFVCEIASKGTGLGLRKKAQDKILLSVDVWTAVYGKKRKSFFPTVFDIFLPFLWKLYKRWQTMYAFLYSPAHSPSNKLIGLSPLYHWVKSHGTKIIIFKQFEVYFFHGLPLPSPSKI